MYNQNRRKFMLGSNSSILYIERSGPAAAPAIVFLHGGGVGGWMWNAVVERLNGEFHCLVPDLPGQANSKPAGPFSHARAADQVADLIRREGPGGKAHVVGLSEGAQVTVELLSRAPEVVDSAFVSSAILRPMVGMWMYSRRMLAWSYRLAMAPFKQNDGWIKLNMKYAAGVPEALYPQFKRSFQETTEDEFVGMLYAGLHYRQPAGLEKAAARTLVLAGEKEYKEMHQSARDLVKALPNARGGMISLGEKSTLAKEHNWALTTPDFFARTLRAWVKGETLPAELKPLE
jgi:pimeloyl-ACP methyl ester carboxylesterase